MFSVKLLNKSQKKSIVMTLAGQQCDETCVYCEESTENYGVLHVRRGCDRKVTSGAGFVPGARL